jgi:hypothetical protein
LRVTATKRHGCVPPFLAPLRAQFLQIDVFSVLLWPVSKLLNLAAVVPPPAPAQLGVPGPDKDKQE